MSKSRSSRSQQAMTRKACEHHTSTRAHQEIRYPNVASCMITYSPLNYDTPVLLEYFKVTRICYISSGRRFTKRALHTLLLSTFRTSSIKFIDMLVCFCGQLVKGQGHGRRSHNGGRKPVAFNLHVVSLYDDNQRAAVIIAG